MRRKWFEKNNRSCDSSFGRSYSGVEESEQVDEETLEAKRPFSTNTEVQ
jgi:hypothetical protein